MSIFSIAGKGLKLDSAADIQPYLDELAALNDVKHINIMGNTIGIAASKALGEALKKQHSSIIFLIPYWSTA